MQLNTNMMNLVTQLMNALVASGSMADLPIYENTNPEVVRLREEFYHAFFKDQLHEDHNFQHGHDIAENILISLISLFSK